MYSSLQFVLGGIILTALGLLMGGASEPGWTLTGSGIGTLLWLAFVSAAAYSLWAILLKQKEHVKKLLLCMTLS